ncbi:hypothetical protein [Longimicrobium sp.]|uniref:hypothetical protein n=1 Tax=Longimicrobium sp. TaxID=2029185 RepID=UPI003B3B7111
MIKKTWALAAAAALLAAPAAAQGDIETICDQFAGTPGSRAERCGMVAQAVDAAQPQLGILMAGGNPTLGTASTGGVRLGMIPRVSLTGRINVVGARMPDIRQASEDETKEFSIPTPAIGANLAMGLTQGISVAPAIGGFGAIDLLASVSVLPLELVGDDFGNNAFSWGAGARVGLIRESFVMPGVSVSLMYRSLGDVKFGTVCAGTETPSVVAPDDPSRRTCNAQGDFGEIDLGLDNWSARAAVSKRLLGLGLTAGVGYDRFETSADFAFALPPTAGNREVIRFTDVAVDNDRWSAFVNGSFTILFGSLVAELGWMQGSDPIQGFPSTSDFDPNEGTFFGSIGARLSL